MSRRARIFFAKLTHFFKQHFGSSRSTSSSLNDRVPPAESGSARPPQPSTTSSPHPPVPSDNPPSPIPSPATVPPRALTPSTSQPTTTPPSLQPPLRSEMPSSEPTSLFSNHDAPASLLSRTPQLPVEHAPSFQSGEPARFAGAHDFILYNPHFTDTSPRGSGLRELLKHSMPDAFHNSAARYPPPKCHLGTRNDYITKIIDWALGNSDHRKPILWMCGPFGIGKSAVAQSCAEALQLQNKLAATLLFPLQY